MGGHLQKITREGNPKRKKSEAKKERMPKEKEKKPLGIWKAH